MSVDNIIVEDYTQVGPYYHKRNRTLRSLSGPRRLNPKTNHITYAINGLGFRSDSYDNDGIMFLGDEDTFGIDVAWEELWTTRIANKLKLSCFNFGVPQGSNDTVFRLAEYWLRKLDGKVKKVIVMSPDPLRLEVIRNKRAVHVTPENNMFSKDPLGVYNAWLESRLLGHLNREKNKDALTWLCSFMDVELIWFNKEDVEDVVSYLEGKI